jgi:hypothetical protein
MKVSLRGTRPAIWRRFKVPESVTLERLHDVVQIVMGWTDTHLHAFHIGGSTIGVPDPEWPDTIDESKVVLADVIRRGVKSFVYEYDFGDDWVHDVKVEKVLEAHGRRVGARCLAGARACPPEDCGGVYGYRELLHVLRNPRHPDHAETRAWAGEWEPETFSLDAVNASLRRLRLTPPARKSG